MKTIVAKISSNLLKIWNKTAFFIQLQKQFTVKT